MIIKMILILIKFVLEKEEKDLDFGHDAWIILDTGGVHVDDSVNTARVIHGKPEISEIHQNS